VVGVNKFGDGQDPPIIPAPNFSALEQGQVAGLRRVKANRDQTEVARTLGVIAAAALSYLGNADAARTALMPLIIDAVRARASVGEIGDTLEQVWGRYQP